MTRNKLIQFIILGLSLIIFSLFVLTQPIQGKILGTAIFALILWSIYPDKHLQGSILIIILLAFFEASIDLNEFIESLFRTYGGSSLWIILSGFILAKSMDVSGLGNRIALKVTTSMGYKPINIILAIGLANLVISPLSPSTTAKAFLLLPICKGLIDVFNVQKGKSNYGTAVMLIAMAANNIASTAFLTATVPNPISAEYLNDLAGINLDWFGWVKMAFPLTLILMYISYLLVIWLFTIEILRDEDLLIKIEQMKERLGSVKKQEKIVIIVFTICLFLWMTESFNPYNAGILSLLLSASLLIPSFEIITLKKFNNEVPWGSISLFAASMFLARAVSKYNALDPVAKSFFEVLGLNNLGSTVFIVGLVTASMLLHVVFTSTTVYATVIIPLIISLTELQGIQIGLIALPVVFLAPIAIIFPVNTIPNIILHDEGWFTEQQMFKYGLLLSLISIIIVLIIGLPYWKFIGLLQ